MTKEQATREALRMALEALENHSGNYKLTKDECVKYRAVEDAIKEALQSNEQVEPFCYVNVNAQGDITRTVKRKDSWCKTPLYAHPPVPTAQPEKELTNLERHERNVQRLFGTPQPKQPEQEPVAWATREDFYRELDRSVERVRKEMEVKSVTMRCKDYDIALPIIDTHFGRVLVGQVSTPPQHKPLTEWQMCNIAEQCGCMSADWIDFARAIEAAHGIKE